MRKIIKAESVIDILNNLQCFVDTRLNNRIFLLQNYKLKYRTNPHSLCVEFSICRPYVRGFCICGNIRRNEGNDYVITASLSSLESFVAVIVSVCLLFFIGLLSTAFGRIIFILFLAVLVYHGINAKLIVKRLFAQLELNVFNQTADNLHEVDFLQLAAEHWIDFKEPIELKTTPRMIRLGALAACMMLIWFACFLYLAPRVLGKKIDPDEASYVYIAIGTFIVSYLTFLISLIKLKIMEVKQQKLNRT